jgi:hypothetical protein
VTVAQQVRPGDQRPDRPAAAHPPPPTSAGLSDEVRIGSVTLPDGPTHQQIPGGYAIVGGVVDEVRQRNMLALLAEQRLALSLQARSRQTLRDQMRANDEYRAGRRAAIVEQTNPDRRRCELCALTHPLTEPAWSACLDHALHLWDLRRRGLLRDGVDVDRDGWPDAIGTERVMK